MIKPRKKLPFLKLENAQTMVEFALVFPIVLLITYGIIEFGRMVFIYAAVTGAARESARYGAAAGDVLVSGKWIPYYTYCDGIKNAAQRGAILTPIEAGNINVWYDHGPGAPFTNPPDPLVPPANICPVGTSYYDKDIIDRGDRIGVHLEVQYEPIIAFLGFTGFKITSENARTILVNIPVATPTPYPSP